MLCKPQQGGLNSSPVEGGRGRLQGGEAQGRRQGRAFRSAGTACAHAGRRRSLQTAGRGQNRAWRSRWRRAGPDMRRWLGRSVVLVASETRLSQKLGVRKRRAITGRPLPPGWDTAESTGWEGGGGVPEPCTLSHSRLSPKLAQELPGLG